MKLVLSATLESLATRADGTIKISLGTQELANDDAGSLFYFRGKFIKVLLSDSEISKVQEDVVDSEKVSAPAGKSKSQRLRAVLYRYHEQIKDDRVFDQFYEDKMEELITHFKNKLER